MTVVSKKFPQRGRVDNGDQQKRLRIVKERTDLWAAVVVEYVLVGADLTARWARMIEACKYDPFNRRRSKRTAWQPHRAALKNNAVPKARFEAYGAPLQCPIYRSLSTSFKCRFLHATPTQTALLLCSKHVNKPLHPKMYCAIQCFIPLETFQDKHLQRNACLSLRACFIYFLARTQVDTLKRIPEDFSETAPMHMSLSAGYFLQESISGQGKPYCLIRPSQPLNTRSIATSETSAERIHFRFMPFIMKLVFKWLPR